MDARQTHWFSTNRHHLRLPAKAASTTAWLLDAGASHSLGRITRAAWIRYAIDLAPYARESGDATATPTPVSADFIDALARHPWRDQPQVRTALQLWRFGLRGGYVWLIDGEPLCLQWLFTHHDNALLRALPHWGGMYPPLPADCGQVENLLTLPAGLRHRGGAAVPFAQAMFALAARRGLRYLITHIHERNGAARRWAERTGWVAYGEARRYGLDLPLLRSCHLHVHLGADAVPQARTAAPRPLAQR